MKVACLVALLAALCAVTPSSDAVVITDPLPAHDWITLFGLGVFLDKASAGPQLTLSGGTKVTVQPQQVVTVNQGDTSVDLSSVSQKSNIIWVMAHGTPTGALAMAGGLTAEQLANLFLSDKSNLAAIQNLHIYFYSCFGGNKNLKELVTSLVPASVKQRALQQVDNNVISGESFATTFHSFFASKYKGKVQIHATRGAAVTDESRTLPLPLLSIDPSRASDAIKEQEKLVDKFKNEIASVKNEIQSGKSTLVQMAGDIFKQKWPRDFYSAFLASGKTDGWLFSGKDKPWEVIKFLETSAKVSKARAIRRLLLPRQA